MRVGDYSGTAHESVRSMAESVSVWCPILSSLHHLVAFPSLHIMLRLLSPSPLPRPGMPFGLDLFASLVSCRLQSGTWFGRWICVWWLCLLDGLPQLSCAFLAPQRLFPSLPVQDSALESLVAAQLLPSRRFSLRLTLRVFARLAHPLVDSSFYPVHLIHLSSQFIPLSIFLSFFSSLIFLHGSELRITLLNFCVSDGLACASALTSTFLAHTLGFPNPLFCSSLSISASSHPSRRTVAFIAAFILFHLTFHQTITSLSSIGHIVITQRLYIRVFRPSGSCDCTRQSGRRSRWKGRCYPHYERRRGWTKLEQRSIQCTKQ